MFGTVFGKDEFLNMQFIKMWICLIRISIVIVNVSHTPNKTIAKNQCETIYDAHIIYLILNYYSIPKITFNRHINKFGFI